MSRLAPFQTHGFEPVGFAGEQAYGNCIFCGKSSKFYVHQDTGQFDCKYCGLSGNVYGFLEEVIRLYGRETSRRDYIKLSRLRSLPVDAFRNWGLVYDGTRWLIPCYSDKGTVRDIRYWSPLQKGIRSTKGCSVQLFGSDTLRNTSGGRVYICEGEWDAMALHWLLDQLTTGESSVVAVPGAATFKDQWVPWFSGRDVVLCYDNDLAGQRGSEKAYSKLKGTARSISAIHWPSSVNDGYDVRDLITQGIEADTKVEVIFEAIQALIRTVSEKGDEGYISVTGGAQVISVGEIPEDQIPSFKQVVRKFRKHIQMSPEMEDALRIAFAVAYSIDVPGDPLWIYLIGPPGCGKTLLLMALQGSDRCVFQSSLSSHSLVSGFNTNPDPSLLPRWNKHCAVLKDFTEIMSINIGGREEIYSTLRGAYDGHVKRSFGNGLQREYFLNFSMVAGVTNAIHGDRQAMLGERFLKYEMFKGQKWTADAEIMAAIDGISKESEIESELMTISGQFLSRKLDVKNLPVVPMWVKARIVALSQLISCLRANVEREFGAEQRLKYKPVREVGTRLAKQLVKLGQMIAFVDAKPEIDDDVYRLMERIAFDTTIGFHLELVQAMMTNQGSMTRKELSAVTGIPPTNLSRSLDDLEALGVIEKRRSEVVGRGRPKFDWVVATHVQELWGRAQIGQSGAKNVRDRAGIGRTLEQPAKAVRKNAGARRRTETNSA